MCSRKNRLALPGLLLAAGMLVAQVRVYDFSTSQGLKIKIIQDTEMPLIHSQLLVFYDNEPNYLSSPAIPHFILYDLFEESWHRSSSKLSGHLQRMGDDFEFQNTPEYIRVIVNFLPGRESTFGAFLKEFFTFAPFSLKKFNRIKRDFWTIFRKNKDWKLDLAFLVAYHHMFGDSAFGRTLITPEQLRTINLAQVNAFYKRNFRPDHALLVIRGNVNPHQMLGVIKSELGFSFESKPFQRPAEKAAVNPSRRVFLVSCKDAEPPSLFFFEVAPPFDNPQFLAFFIVQYTLCHFPFGRIYHSRSPFTAQMKNYPLSNDVVGHRDFSVICSHTAASPGDIESIIAQMDAEKRRLSLQEVRREEFGVALNFLQGKATIDSTRYETEVEIEIGKLIAENKPIYAPPLSGMVQKVSFEGIGEVVGEYFAFQRSGSRERGVVVIIGNEEQILAQWKGGKPEILRLFEEK